MGELPVGWVLCSLEDCIEILDSMRKPINNKERNNRIHGKTSNELYPYYGATGQVGLIDGYLFDEELVALGEDGVPFFDTLKEKAYILYGKTWVNNHAHVLKGSNGINNKYVCYYLNQIDYHGYVNGATRLKLTQANMRKLPFFLAPLNEQIRIANKLDTLLAKVEAAQTRLDKIPTLLKRFRQSVLAAATSGELTAEWRRENSVNIENWEETIFSELSVKITVGYVGKMADKYLSNGIPFLRSQNVRAFKFDKKNLLYISEDFHQQIYKSRLESGDLAIVRSGAPGTTCVIPKTLKIANCSDLVIVRPNEKLNSQYGCIFMNAPIAQKNVLENQVGVAQQHFNVGSMKIMPISLPNLEEQKQIVRRVESLFTLADSVEKQYQQARQRTDKLTQSLLAKAFRGELVPQDTNDEPAEKLLARIQAEREKLKPKKTRKKTQ